MALRRVTRSYVRGERPRTDLRTIGIEVQLEGNRCTYQNPRDLEVSVDIHDLAKGFLTHLQDARNLREWAFVLEASDMELRLEDHPAPDARLRFAVGLWDSPQRAVRPYPGFLAHHAEPERRGLAGRLGL